ncbi:MAG: transcriptional regulator [Pseudarthrobacter sp.]|nr:transcriptional regulator [Pseudarthrobacter sp.]
MTSNLDPDARNSYRLLTLAARMVQRQQDDALAPLGLTRAAVIALEGLAAGPLNQEQLADVVHVQSQTLGRVLLRLEGSGHVTRTRQATDRRQFRVELTEAGAAAVSAARQAEINAYPQDAAIGWAVLQRELAKLVGSLPATSLGSDVLRFPEPESGPSGQGGHARLHGVDNRNVDERRG